MTKVTPISSSIDLQEYNSKDSNLINAIKLQRNFGLPEDYVEVHVYDLNDTLLTSQYNFTNYRNDVVPSPGSLVNELVVSPDQDSSDLGYNYGSTKLIYNVLRNLFLSSFRNKFYITTISTDRTELRITNNSISNSDLEIAYNNFVLSFSAEAYYKDLYLNFGNNDIIIGVNVILEKSLPTYNLLVKLYDPLPANFVEKDQFWITDKLSEPIAYQVDFETVSTFVETTNYLKGPNFNISIGNEVNSSIDYKNYNQLFSTTSTSSYQQLKSLLEEKSLDINIDYTEYENFVHFSSAKERLLNFVYKLKLIEGYQQDWRTLSAGSNTPQISSSKAIIENNINNIIEKFDGYEYYLYYESGSKAWPKKSSTKPYVNFETTASSALVWLGSDNDSLSNGLYGGQTFSASLYDNDNKDNLIYTIPEYLRIDSQNESYEVFLHMIGQHFDNIWLYSKGITDLYDAKNNIYKGVSKDLVSYALKSLGIKLYTNTSTTDNVFSYLLGVTPSGSLLPSTGSEILTSYVTASSTTLSGADIDKEVYKRIYHNLPYLLKTKGTERGLRALISCYGIPNTILRINEFGGVDKDSGSIEQYFNRTSYTLSTSGSVYVATPWAPSLYQNILTSSGNIVPDTVEFRFKTTGIPSSSFYSQSLFQVNSGSATQFGVQLLFTSQSNSGGFVDYGDIRLVISGTQGYTYSSPIHLPFFDGGWWNVAITRNTGSIISSSITGSNTYSVYVANSIYNGSDGENIGYIGSSSLFITGSDVSSSYHRAWNLYDTSSFNAYLGGENSSNRIGSASVRFNGFIQELRYWSVPLSLTDFMNHTLNPLSYELGSITSSYSSLIFRVPLGNDLQISGSNNVFSIHPTFGKTGSFDLSGGVTSSYATIVGNVLYDDTTSFYYLNSGNVGYNKPVNDKIRILTQDEVSGSTLSLYTKVFQNPEIKLTKDINVLEVALSPQDQINSDIIAQLGYFNIDDYIGDPRESGSVEYRDLRTLREFYFQKYSSRYNLFDFIRLIKYYNNSIFKMIKDFVPARTNTSTGIVVKSHALERSKVKRFEPVPSFNNNLSESINLMFISGGSGVTMRDDLLYGYTSSISTLSGSLLFNNNKSWERFTGELSGSKIVITDQSLQNNNIYVYASSSINRVNFDHSDFNVTLNNVSSSRLSNNKFDTDYSNNPNIATNLSLIISESSIIYAPVQDSNYTLTRHINPRYVGSRTTSQTYNRYTVGDKSYGQTAAIDTNSKKLGLFVSISGSIFLPGKQETRLKYLVDELGNLTELNNLNENWFEVQNMFKAGGSASIALFDNTKFSNQKSTDGVKTIYTSGYNYLPYLYFSGSQQNLSFFLSSTSNYDIFKYNNASSSYIPVTLASSSDPASSTLSYLQYIGGTFIFTLSNAIYSTDITIISASVIGYANIGSCGIQTESDLLGSNGVIYSGSTIGSGEGKVRMTCDVHSYSRGEEIIIQNSTPTGSLSHGSTFTIAGCSTTFTLSSNTFNCNSYECNPI